MSEDWQAKFERLGQAGEAYFAELRDEIRRLKAIQVPEQEKMDRLRARCTEERQVLGKMIDFSLARGVSCNREAGAYAAYGQVLEWIDNPVLAGGGEPQAP